MKTRLALALTVLAGAATVANAQNMVTFNWSWAEVVANSSNPATGPLAGNGFVDEGEGAELRLSVSFTPAVGGSISYTPPPGSGTGTVGGLGTVFFDLIGSNNTAGTFTNGRRAAGLTLGSHGSYDNGNLMAVQAGQLALPESPLLQVGNPVNNTWRIVWNPTSYTERTVTFTAQKGVAVPPGNTGASLHVQYAGTPEEPQWISLQMPVSFGSIQIPVVPSPSSLALLGLGGLVIARRRR
jgi:hypothetical protein